ncbi:MAG: GNAT family N-acetyltransferase [Alphaproteobacteria bacterium]|nr:GNAT family N-acetyltransferase [Alphaproteobacteria bacterium]
MTAAPPTLATKRLALRPYVAGDEALLHAIVADPRVYWWREAPGTEAESAAALRALLALGPRGLGWWHVHPLTDEARHLGAILLRPLPNTREVEVGWHFLPQARGHGYATEAGAAAIAYGFETLGLPRIACIVRTDNPRSRAVAGRLRLPRLGMRLHAGKLHDYFILERTEWLAGLRGRSAG